MWGLQGWHRDTYVRSSAATDLVLPRPGFLLMDVTRLRSQPIEAGKGRDDHPIFFACVYYEDSIGALSRSASFPRLGFIPLFRNWQSFSFVHGRFNRWNRGIGVSLQPHTCHLQSEAHFESQFDKFEVPVGDPRAMRWVTCRKKLNIHGLTATPVEGGTISKNGAPLYLTRVRYDDGVHAAKI